MNKVENALASDIDITKLESINAKIDSNVRIINGIVNSLVEKYCGDLDAYMRQIDNILVNQDEPVTDTQLEDFTLNLPSLLYFTAEGMEALGIEEDIARAIRQELYNKTREKAEGTIADKDSAAELATQAESVVLICKSRAYKRIKLKQEAGYEMLNSVKKIISKRIADTQLSMSDVGEDSRWQN